MNDNEKMQAGQPHREVELSFVWDMLRARAFVEGKVLLSRYLQSHEMDEEVALLCLCACFGDEAVLAFLTEEQTECTVDTGEVDAVIENARENLDLLGRLSPEKQERFLLYLDAYIASLLKENKLENDKFFAFFERYASLLPRLCFPDVLSQGIRLAGSFRAQTHGTREHGILTQIMTRLHFLNQTAYAMQATELGRYYVSLGQFDLAKEWLENAVPALEERHPCCFLLLCVALGVRSEEEFLNADGFDYEMEEYINLLIASKNHPLKLQHYISLAHENQKRKAQREEKRRRQRKTIKIVGIVSAVTLILAVLLGTYLGMASKRTLYPSKEEMLADLEGIYVFDDGTGTEFLTIHNGRIESTAWDYISDIVPSPFFGTFRSHDDRWVVLRDGSIRSGTRVYERSGSLAAEMLADLEGFYVFDDGTSTEFLKIHNGYIESTDWDYINEVVPNPTDGTFRSGEDLWVVLSDGAISSGTRTYEKMTARDLLERYSGNLPSFQI